MKRTVSPGRIVTAGMVGVLLSISPANAGELDPNLERILLETPADEVVSVLVWLADRVDILAVNHELNVRRAPLAQRHEFVVRSLQEKAAATQVDLDLHLNQLLGQGRIDGFQAMWIDNVIRLDAVPSEIEAIAARPDVDRVHFNYRIELIEPEAGAPANGAPEGGIEPGVVAVRAPEVWALGITGAGVVVATLDTGVDGNHPALASRWRGLDPAYLGNPGWAWFDPVTGTSFPQSFGSHGTHTMGSVCGGAPGDQVGVAPGAQWIHAAVIDRVSIAQTITDALLAFQWVIDPDGNPGTDFDVPDVCSNSWGLADFHGVPDCDEFFWSAMDACEAAGIVIVFSAGNEGSGGLRRPADRGTDDYRTFAVGGVDANVPAPWPAYGGSSRGPTDCGPNGESVIKPEISAPAVSVRSSVPGGGYSNLTGTSMASPHVNGVIALMRQANPDIPVDNIKQIIYDTAFDLGTPGKDNQFGYGMIDAFEAVQLAMADSVFFSFPAGLPDVIDPAGGTVIPVVITGTATIEPGSATLHLSTGGGFSGVPMTETAPGEYDAVFPAVTCPANVAYYFSIGVEGGEPALNPADAPNSTYAAGAYTGTVLTFSDRFSADLGWTVDDDAGLTSGTWERGVPVNAGLGDPPNDVDGGNRCYVTQNVAAVDVDGGTTTLTSPPLDATDPDATLGYSRWYSNGSGGNTQDDVLVVEVSDDDGANWVTLETVGPTGTGTGGGWIGVEFLVGDVPGITNTNQFRVRFHASDLGGLNTVEAGVDLVQVFTRFCDDVGCSADLDGDNVVGINDFLDLLAAWGPNPGHPADLDGDNVVGINDFLSLLKQWGPC